MMFTVTGFRRAAAAVAGLLTAALLVSCGGGEKVQTFTPLRIIALGDESSVINADGSKYTVNAVFAGTTKLDCSSNPLWVQYVADLYFLAFPQCNPNNVAAPASRIYAVAGAKEADLATQISQNDIVGGGFSGSDLVTILIGQNDILQAYAQYPALSEDQLEANLKALGVDQATQINALVATGAKVLVATVPDLGYTPFGFTEKASHGDVDRSALLSALTLAYNTGMRANIVNDGTKIGLVLEDERIPAIAFSPLTYGFINITNVACAKPLPTCTTSTLAVDPNSTNGALASGTTWLWADATHLSAGGQHDLGLLAGSRATNNPF